MTALQPLSAEHMCDAGRDAANRQMRAAGRTKWNGDDAALACKTQARLMLNYGDKYQQMAAESALQRMGVTDSQQCAKKDHVRNSALSQIYAEAAALMECEGYANVSAASDAIARVTWRLSFRVRAEANIVFRDNFGCWINNAEGILMLCFASAMAATGELDYLSESE